MLRDLLQKHQIKPSQVILFNPEKALKLDLSKDNQALAKVDVNDEQQFTDFVFHQIEKAGAEIGWGGYGEERALYSRSDLFGTEEPRSIHLGIDLWTAAGTPVYAPMDGKIHSFDNRAYHGDYGPVIILEHNLGETTFFSLYGHLSKTSLEGKKVGQVIKHGELFAWLGAYDENVHWPPHLHFQIMLEMEGNVGDYPGVCKASEKERYLANCLNPEVFMW